MAENSTVLKENPTTIVKPSSENKKVNILNLRVVRRDGSITPFKSEKISNAIKKALKLDKLEQSSIYGKGKASKKIIKYLEEIKLDRKLLQKQITY